MYIQLDNCTQQKFKKFLRPEPTLPFLLRHHSLDQISGLVDIDSTPNSQVERQQLQRNYLKEWGKQVARRGKMEAPVAGLLYLGVTLRGDGKHSPSLLAKLTGELEYLFIPEH